MRFTNNEICGIERLRKNETYRPQKSRKKIHIPYIKVESDDTKIRRDIYATIISMIKEKKSDIEIEIFLRNKYPDYAEVIPKFISDQFAKYSSNKKVETEAKETGDER